MTAPCIRCDGCGQLANSDGREAWTSWASLPLGSDLAVRAGLVHPIPCDVCGGTGETPQTRVPARDIDQTGRAPALSDEDTDAWHAFALNSETFSLPVRRLLMPAQALPIWSEYAEANDDLWDLNHGADPYRYCDADPKLICAADARAFAIDERTQRRDETFAELVDVLYRRITGEAP